MRKFLLLIIGIFALVGCSKSDSIEDNKESALQKSDIVGVWKSGDYFVSFSDGNYYIAYLTGTFIDSGYFKLDGTNVKCDNNYFKKSTIINIESLKNNLMDCKINYIDGEGKAKSLDKTFTKSSEEPAKTNHVVIGKFSSSRFFVQSNGASFDYNTNYSSANGGYEEVTSGTMKDVRRNLYYVYLHPFVYIQRYKYENGKYGTYPFNYDILEVYKRDVTIGKNGNVSIGNFNIE